MKELKLYLLMFSLITGTANSQNLEALLCRLNVGYESVTDEIPEMYTFVYDGINQINDGGDDMYDGGNMLNSNLASGINYSNDFVTYSGHFGPGTSYFTRHLPGLFVMGANVNGISEFSISGFTGADGLGTVNGFNTELAAGDGTYQLFVKRIFGTSDPSINHVVLVKNGSGASHSWPTSTNSDAHDVTGIEAATQVYFLLFASNSGGFINDDQITNVASAFLSLVTPMEISGTSSLYEICENDTVVLNASGAYTYEWNIDGVVNGEPHIPLSTGDLDYIVNGLDEDGCVNGADTVNILVHDLPSITAHSSDSVICYGEECILFGDGGDVYNWASFPILNNEPFTMDTTGFVMFNVLGTDTNACSNNDSITVFFNEEMLLTTHVQDELEGMDGEAGISVSGGTAPYLYNWNFELDAEDFGEIDTLFELSSGTYSVTVMDSLGCLATEEIIVGTQLGVENLLENGFLFYPNPVQNTLFTNSTLPTRVELWSKNGELIWYTTEEVLTTTIDMSDLAPGIYILRSYSSQGEDSYKVIKE